MCVHSEIVRGIIYLCTSSSSSSNASVSKTERAELSDAFNMPFYPLYVPQQPFISPQTVVYLTTDEAKHVKGVWKLVPSRGFSFTSLGWIVHMQLAFAGQETQESILVRTARQALPIFIVVTKIKDDRSSMLRNVLLVGGRWHISM